MLVGGSSEVELTKSTPIVLTKFSVKASSLIMLVDVISGVYRMRFHAEENLLQNVKAYMISRLQSHQLITTK